MRTTPLILVSLFTVWLFVLVACTPGSSDPQQVEFADLIENPEDYTGERVCTQGVHLVAFEVDALGSGTYTQEGSVYLSEPTIWVAGAEIEGLDECVTADSYPGATFCPVEACGVFETGGGFGHVGAWEFQLSGLER